MEDQRQRRRQAAVEQDKKNRTGADAPPGSFSNYKPVPGKPGFYIDPNGNLKYIPT